MKVSKPNTIEKALSYISPKAAATRYKARLSFEAASHYAASGSRRQTQEWTVSKGYDPDSDMFGELATMRDRSRDLIRNNPLAAGSLRTKVTSVIGNGLMFQSRVNHDLLDMTFEQGEAWNELVEAEFNSYFGTANCDMERTLNFGSIQALGFRSMLENGDAFALLPFKKRSGDVYGTKVQLVEADRVSNPDDRGNSDNLFDGIEFDPVTGEPLRAHICNMHPNKFMTQRAKKWDTVDFYGKRSRRKQVIHVFQKNRIGQHRGLPDLAPVVEYFKQLGNYTDSEIMAAVISSMFTVFIKSDSQDLSPLAPMEPTKETGGRQTDNDYKMGVGAILELGLNEDIEFANPSRPNTAFDGFVTAMMRQIAVGLELPYEILIKHFNSSYSASRAAMVVAYQYFFEARKAWVENFCMPIYEAWLTEAILLGRIDAPGFEFDPVVRAAYLNSQWIGPEMPQIDEGKEVEASIKRIGANLSTLSDEVIKHGGKDWQGVLRQRAREKDMQSELNLTEVIQTENRGRPPVEDDDDET